MAASRQLVEVLSYLEYRNPQAAQIVGHRIRRSLMLLLDHPHAGIETSRRGMRRTVVHPYPYAVFYRATDHEIVVHGIRHTARRPLA